MNEKGEPLLVRHQVEETARNLSIDSPRKKSLDSSQNFAKFSPTKKSNTSQRRDNLRQLSTNFCIHKDQMQQYVKKDQALEKRWEQSELESKVVRLGSN
mmetsp:Transcript_7235/g.10696  ORF Transcript_7235/g.10696 Transcript_7235/m.10696 type:complete len:99 (-) Transcript_7235:23-319(-)